MKYWEEIENRVSVADALSMYASLRPNRGGFVCCPFHNEKTPSMKISEKGYYCFGCHEHGNVIGFVMKYFKLDFKSACSKINYDFRLNLPIDRTLTPEERAENKRRWIEEQREIRDRKQFQEFKENYIRKNVNRYKQLENEILEYHKLFYKDSDNIYKVGDTNDIPFVLEEKEYVIHVPIDHHNFNSEMLDDEDFQQHIETYLHLVKEFNSLVLPSEEQLRTIYNSTKSRFYINK